MSEKEWLEEYALLINNPPIEGDYLLAQEGKKIKLELVLRTGEEPFIFAYAYVPDTVGCDLTWLGSHGNKRSGMKVILLPSLREKIISNNIKEVKMLRVVKVSKSGKSVLATVEEW